MSARAEPGEARTSSVGAGAHEYDEGVEEGEVEPEETPPKNADGPQYRNPQGSLSINGIAGASTGDSGTRIVLGLGVGYAVLTGVMPGVRGLLITGSGGTGAELDANVTLTPPFSASFVPFVVGEIGRRFDAELSGYLYGAGAGVYLGDPGSHFAFQVGWIFRRLALDDGGKLDASGPIILISARF